jgi:hypothetical protein
LRTLDAVAIDTPAALATWASDPVERVRLSAPRSSGKRLHPYRLTSSDVRL